MGTIIKNGILYGGGGGGSTTPTAENTFYDNTNSHLESDNVQGAIDIIERDVKKLNNQSIPYEISYNDSKFELQWDENGIPTSFKDGMSGYNVCDIILVNDGSWKKYRFFQTYSEAGDMNRTYVCNLNDGTMLTYTKQYSSGHPTVNTISHIEYPKSSVIELVEHPEYVEGQDTKWYISITGKQFKEMVANKYRKLAVRYYGARKNAVDVYDISQKVNDSNIDITYSNGVYNYTFSVNSVAYNTTLTDDDIVNGYKSDVIAWKKITTLESDVAELKQEIANTVKTVNHISPDENGNVNVQGGGGTVVTDKTLTIEDASADAKATGDRITELSDYTLIHVETERNKEHINLPDFGKNVIIYGNSGARENVKIYDSINYFPYPYVLDDTASGMTFVQNSRYIELSGTNTSGGTYSKYITDGLVDIPTELIGKTVNFELSCSDFVSSWLTLTIEIRDADKASVYNKVAEITNTKNKYTVSFTIPSNAKTWRYQLKIANALNVDGVKLIPLIYPNDAVVRDLGRGLQDGEELTINEVTNTIISTSEYDSVVAYDINTKEYIDNHSGGVTPEQVYSLMNYVTPEQFGAKGDLKNDDTEAINNCIQYAQSKGYPVYMGGRYLISDSLIIDTEKQECNINYIKYTGTNSAIQIANNEIKVICKYIEAPDGTAVSMLADTASYYGLDLYVDRIYAKNYGFWLRAVNHNIMYSKLKFNRINVNADDGICVFLNSGSASNLGGAVSEISVYGGWMNSGLWGIVCQGSGNCFYNIGFEGANLKNGIQFSGATNNVFGLRHAEFDIDPTKTLIHFTGARAAYNNIFTNYPVKYDTVSVEGLVYDSTFDGGPCHNRIYAQITTRRAFEIGSIGLAKMGKFIMQKDYTNGSVLVSEDMSFDETLSTTFALPAIFIANSDTIKTATLGISYCSDGLNRFKVIQKDGKKIAINTYDGTNIFNGNDYGDGEYILECHAVGYIGEELNEYYYGRSESDNLYDEWMVTKINNDSYSKSEIDSALGTYITDVASLVGGDA